MKDFEKKTIKYLVLLTGLLILQSLKITLLNKVIDFYTFTDFGMTNILIISFSNYFLNAIFAVILYLDCRKGLNNIILIPLLGLLAPIVGVMFYFIERYSLNKQVQC